MNIIQSYWSKPVNVTKPETNWAARKAGGWNHKKYHYMSWALSCLLLKRYYGSVVLITDENGKDALINKLGLPYTKTIVELDCLNHYHEDLWAVGKLYSYGIQTEPFIHFDNDVFVWDKFNNDTLESGLISQNIEIDFHFDVSILNDIFKNFDFIPDVIRNNPPTKKLVSCNAGVFGGCDHKFFASYSRQSFEFINANLGSITKVNTGLSNIIFEQYLFACLAREASKPISYIFHDINNDYARYLCNFPGVPRNTKYIHIIGPYKKVGNCENWLADRLRLEFPEYYYHIMNLIETSEL